MKESSPAICLQPALHGHSPVTRRALQISAYKRHGVEVEGQLLGYAVHDGRLTDVCSMARLTQRER
ncbi:hypothetical protein [Pseudomonas alkylphenolica]|uniref:hypothetical protein n=1 Tax=Pseudomonas alkylphenolica TaxID=237609 RepID=UPI000FEB7386|nr:hypothetical protein [Pseudomonas alkylphenolica]MBH3426143.1 hypothetical protein [Pseudomonas alkylphenolica]